MVEKQDTDHCSVLGGQQMILTGQNFSSDSKVVFMEKSQGELACDRGDKLSYLDRLDFPPGCLHDANEKAAALLPFALHFLSDLRDVPHMGLLFGDEWLSPTRRADLPAFVDGNSFVLKKITTSVK